MSDTQSPARRPTARTRVRGGRLVLVWSLLLVSTIAWRNGVYFDGGLDPVVAAKGLLSLSALLIALHAWRTAPHRFPVGGRTLVLVVSYLLVTVLGGWAAGSPVPSAVLAARVLVIALIVLLLAACHPMGAVVHTLCIAMTAVGLVCALTGVGSVLSGHRLSGGLFPVSPNQISLLLGVPAIALAWGRLHGRRAGYGGVALAALVTIIWLTGSRTGLLALVLGLVVVLVHVRRVSPAGFLGFVAAVPLLVYLSASSPVLSDYFARGGTSSISTLNSRTIAWHAAFTAPTGLWQHWLGGGLATKTVGVSGAYWNAQVLDSSWVSAFVQAGVVGVLLLAVLSVGSLVSSLHCPRPVRALWAAVVVYVLVLSITTSGLVDAYVLFVAMLVASVATEPATRHLSTTAAGRRPPADPAGGGR